MSDPTVNFLINLARSASAVDKRYLKVLDLYIALSYGDPGKPRTIPFDLARSQGLFSKEVTALEFQAAKKTEEERLAFRVRFIPEEEQDRAHWRRSERESKPRDRLRAMEGKITLMRNYRSKISGGRTGNRHNIICDEDFIWYPANVYTWYIWFSCYQNIQKLLIPYQTAKFSETEAILSPESQAAGIIGKIGEGLKIVEPWKYGSRKYMEYMGRGGIRYLMSFLKQYQEGALVMLALLDCAGKGWGGGSDDISLSEFPGIEGKDPVEVWCLVEKLRVLMREALGERNFASVFSKYLEGYGNSDEDLYWAGFQTRVVGWSIYDCIKYRKDVQALEAILTERWSWFVRQHSAAGEWWKKSSTPVRYYLLCRAADSLSFGERYSSLPRSTFGPYEEVVSALVSLSKDTKARLDEAEEKEAAARERQRIEKKCAEEVEKICYGPPAILESRVLTASEIQEVRIACVRELSQDLNTFRVAATIDDFAEFCKLLAQPENRVKGRYASTRTEADMVNEMARGLVGLPKYAAYARITQSIGGEQRVWKGQIRTDRI